MGIKIFGDIEEMIKRGVKPDLGRERNFEVREIDSGKSFIRNYLIKEL